MDDICESVHSVDQAQRLVRELDKVLETGGLQVKGWLSNKKSNTENTVLEEINKSETECLKGSVQEKVLGTIWNPHDDTLSFYVRPPEKIKLNK